VVPVVSLIQEQPPVIPEPVAKEQVMSINAESTIADVFHAVADLVSNPTFQAMLPVVIGALQSGSVASSPVSAGLFGAQLVTDLAAVLPKIDAPAFQASVTLVEGILTALTPKVAMEPVPTPNQSTVQVATIEGQVTQ
jgi:hypothetical protein